MNFKYDFSIIIPVYNNSKYIDKCIDSILKQDYDLSKIQILLINDGSKDNSLSICNHYAKKYQNVVVINQENKGVSVARNNGIKKAQGKYILFLDSDDFLSSNVCSTIFTFFEKNYQKIDIVTYPLQYIKNGKLKKHFRYGKIYDDGNFVYDINKKSELIQTTINFCIKNRGKENHLFERKMIRSEDEMYATKVILEKGKFGYCSDCTYYYRMHNANTIHKYSITLKEFKKYTNYYIKLLQDHPNNTYVVNLALNNLRWRLEEDKLIPITEEEKLKQKLIKSIKELVSLINVESIMKLSYLKTRTRLALLSLKDSKYDVTLKDDKVVIKTENKKYTYPNIVEVKITKVKKNQIAGYIEKAFDLFKNNGNENLTIYPYSYYQNSYIEGIIEYKFRLSVKQRKCDITKELGYQNVHVTQKRNTNFLYKVKTKENIVYIVRKPIKTTIIQVLKKLGAYEPMKKIYQKSISLSKRILQKIKRSLDILLYKFYCKKTSLDSNKVLFLSASRDSLTGNFEFVYNELKKNYDFEIHQVLKRNLKTKYSIKEKKELMKLIASSKFILLDDFYPMIYALKLRKETELIQLWHAMGAFKTVGYSRMGKVGGPSVKSLTHKNYTATIVSSENIRKNYAEAFDISIDKVHALGIPRTDIFFDEKYKKNITTNLKKKYPFIKNKKVILFAPTFRGNGQKSAYYNFDWIDFQKIKEALKEEYVFLIKLHPFITDRPNIIDHEFYFDLSDEREINDLLFITDVLITDYSSVIFEYSFFKKPVVFFIPDYKEYEKSRDFYYDFDKYMYGSIANDTNRLIKEIKKEKVDLKKINQFYDYFCSSCDGKSTKRVVEELIVKKK